jgi:hypothetical protein
LPGDTEGQSIKLRINNMICTVRDEHIRKLIMEDISMTWKCTLDDGTIVWGDYERPGVAESPWVRLQKFCKENGRCIAKAQVIVMGAPEEIVFEDEDGLDGFFIARGFSKDIDMVTGDGPSYQHMTFGLLEDDLERVDIKKYSWPECEFEDFSQKRKATQENLSFMIWRDGETKKQSEQVQVTLNG